MVPKRKVGCPIEDMSLSDVLLPLVGNSVVSPLNKVRMETTSRRFVSDCPFYHPLGRWWKKVG